MVTQLLFLSVSIITIKRYCTFFFLYMTDKEMIEEKIGEAIGLEKAAQKAVDEIDSLS